MKIYLAGPMRGHREFNFPAFDRATAALRTLGHEVFSPAEHDRSLGYDFTGCEGTEAELAAHGFDFRVALAGDLDWICRQADAVVLMPGWSQSEGAKHEQRTAVLLHLRTYWLDELCPGLNEDSDFPPASEISGSAIDDPEHPHGYTEAGDYS